MLLLDLEPEWVFPPDEDGVVCVVPAVCQVLLDDGRGCYLSVEEYLKHCDVAGEC